MKKIGIWLYVSMFACSIIAFAICINKYNTDFFSDYFFRNGADRFMDFFNSIRDAKDGDVYELQGVIYPAFTNIIFWSFSIFLPKELVNTSFAERYEMLDSVVCLMSYIIFVAIVYWLLYALIRKSSIENKFFKSILFISIIVSMPALYTLERGNILLLSTISLIGFVLLYDHDNKKIREISLILLAISTAIKIYPVIFIFLLVINKKYKETVKALIYIVFLVGVPFIFYDGFNGAMYMFESMMRFSNKHSNAEISSYAVGLTPFLNRFNIEVLGIYNILYDALLIVIALLTKKNWVKALMFSLFILNFSGSQIIYNSMYLIIPLMVLFKEENFCIFDIVAIVLFGFVLFPNAIQLSNVENGLNPLLWENAMFFIVIGLIFISILDIIFSKIKIRSNYREKKLSTDFKSNI